MGQNRWPDPRLTSPAMTSSIELPSSPWLVPPIPLRPLLPICPPTLAQPLPALPSPHRAPQIHPSFALSTHIVPAAYIRSSPHVPRPPPSIMPAPSLGTGKKPTKEEKLRKATEVRNWLLEARENDADDGAGYKSVLWNCVNRYYRIDSGRGRATGRGLTLFFAHANGFPKEVRKRAGLARLHRLTRIGAPGLGADNQAASRVLCRHHRRGLDVGSGPHWGRRPDQRRSAVVRLYVVAISCPANFDLTAIFRRLDRQYQGYHQLPDILYPSIHPPGQSPSNPSSSHTLS